MNIADKCSERNANIIRDNYGNLSSDGMFSVSKMWKLKKKLNLKQNDVLTAKLDSKGNLITSYAALKGLYKETYMNRLTSKPPLQGYEQITCLKDYLFNLRRRLSAKQKSVPWNENQLYKVCKTLKNGKARDQHGMIFELFKPQFAGNDLLASLLIMFNEMKSNLFVPDFMKTMSITRFYKKRGNKADLSNDRGVFNLVKVRSVLDKLIYQDIYPDIDQAMSQSNIGARRGRNIWDHLFVIYSIINEVKSDKKEDLEIQSIDIVKCYDELNYSETHNDLFDVGVNDDKFNLITKLDEECHITVKTPVGPSEQFKLNEIILQGSVLGPIKCSVQLDTLGRDTLSDSSEQCTVFKYKDSVEVPPLALMDDNLAVNTCARFVFWYLFRYLVSNRYFFWNLVSIWYLLSPKVSIHKKLIIK